MELQVIMQLLIGGIKSVFFLFFLKVFKAPSSHTVSFLPEHRNKAVVSLASLAHQAADLE